MEHGHRNKRGAEKFEWALQGVQRDARHGAERWFVVENVGEEAPDDTERFFVAVNGYRRPLADIEGANVVKAEDVVGVAVRQQNGIEAFQPNAERLLAEVRRGINHHVPAAA